MTWLVASFALLAVALAAGFAWYERTHPPAKVLALVATLAALAVLGRIAFAPLPNVKPTMALVLIAGYVLGGAPGFAVGAVTALASNVFFGQGPFTPWQMVGFGALGLVGAGLARVSRRRAGRLVLAAVAFAGGVALGAFLDFGDWVLYSDHSLGAYWVYAGRGVAFDLALGVGNAAFCLAFGPALVRALRRYRDRFDVTWHAAPGAGAVVAALLVLVIPFASPAPASADTVGRAVSYLRAAQTSDGGFASARGGASANAMHTGWAALGLAATGRAPGCAALGYLRGQARSVSELGDVERTLLALHAAGGSDPALATRLARARRADGSFGRLVNLTAFGVLALRAAGRAAPPAALRYLARQQNRDGGFNFGGRGGPSGVDDTAGALQALVAGGRRGSVSVRRATRFLLRAQDADGGFPLSPGAGSNAQSTAWAVQALVAAGRGPARVRARGSRSPLAYLRTLQAADGSIRYSRTSRQTPTWVTAQALIALGRAPLPVPARRASCGERARAAGAGTGTASRAPAAASAHRAAAGSRAGRARHRRPGAPKQTARARAGSRRLDLRPTLRRAGRLTALLFVPVTR